MTETERKALALMNGPSLRIMGFTRDDRLHLLDWVVLHLRHERL